MSSLIKWSASAFIAVLCIWAGGTSEADPTPTPPSSSTSTSNNPKVDQQCTSSTGATAGSGGFTGTSDRSCDNGKPDDGKTSGAKPAVTRVVSCGPVQVRGHLLRTADDVCGQVRDSCAIEPDQIPTADATATTAAYQTRQPDGTWTLTGLTCANHPATPQITPLLIAQQARRLVPHPSIGIAPPGGATLVNIQTLLWLNTPATQQLTPITLLGHHITITITITEIHWTFGDGHTDTTTNPEPAYNPADHCHTITCPGYWGHTYTTPGPTTITATTTWTGTYTDNGHNNTDIPGTVTAPPSHTTLTIRQAHTELVDPTNPPTN
jgi:hypothetical protein